MHNVQKRAVAEYLAELEAEAQVQKTETAAVVVLTAPTALVKPVSSRRQLWPINGCSPPGISCAIANALLRRWLGWFLQGVSTATPHGRWRV
jgi:hypothetical protein